VASALWLTYRAKSAADPAGPSNAVNLHDLDRPEKVLPHLTIFQSSADRQYAARKIYEYLADQRGRIPNVGSLGRIRVRQTEVLATPRLQSFRERVREARERTGGAPIARDATISLLTPPQIAGLKRSFVVRDAGSYRNSLLLWAGLYFLAFWSVLVFWRSRGFTGSNAILPALHLLSGTGFVLMVALRDPLRDTLSIVNFAQGAIAGCLILGILSQVDYNRKFAGLSFVPLALSLALSAVLVVFGSGPGTSDAKVNLGPFQPVELIKILLVFFLAGYFARRWELLRELRERRPELARLTRWMEVPRLEYLLPVVAAIALVLAFFFLQKDLGPALVFACVFLTLYAVARNRVQLALFGLFVLVGGFLGGYWIGYPRTVSDRVAMWLSPWDNAVRGGDQVVHGWWGMSTGGFFGTGLGLGESGFVPAAHTDLILAVLGEEWGFAGIVAIALIYCVLVLVGLRTAMRAGSDYTFFLALGLTVLTALQLIMIAGGVLGLIPLSGVVTPFLNYGRTSMIANCMVFGILLALSSQGGTPERNEPFRIPVRWTARVFGGIALLLLARAAYLQVLRADVVAGSGALVVQADGARRYQYNPRLTEIARSIPRGSIYDRNGLPIATSNWEELAQNRKQFAVMGVDIDRAADKSDSRHYPLGAAAYHLLGDLRTRSGWSARNNSLQERDSAVRLQGYDDRARVVEVTGANAGRPAYTIRYDYRELLPVLRNRYNPEHPDVKRILERERNVRMSIDARLQLRASAILKTHLKRAGKQRGAVVILDAESGDLLASVSEPAPELEQQTLTRDSDDPGPMLDRARYGLYPPGSTFKIVTAMAALRKDPQLHEQSYQCIGLPDGRVGNYIGNSKRPIRDDVADRVAHGTVDMRKGITVSCNAYFAQLGTYKVGASSLLETANLLGIAVAAPANEKALRDALPQASYGQGQVVASPFQMARAAATIGAGGRMPFGRWVIDETNPRVDEPKAILASSQAALLAGDMRLVVTSGTGRKAGGAIPIAGKTGTAELKNAPSHAWFVGFAPFRVPQARMIAFAIIVENGQYGGSAAAPMAPDLVAAADSLGILEKGERE
jgi:cell division protein FtsW (lipid II flippase)/cell division protein FtsI/penicillin-binding protein 2